MNRVAPRSARSTLSSGELVGAVSGLGLLVVSFLPWYSAGGHDLTAWQAFSVIDIVMAAAAAAALSVAIVVAARVSVSYPPAGSSVTGLFGIVAFACVLFRLIDPPGGADVGREAGVWLGLLATAGIALGGYLGMQEPRPRSQAAGPDHPQSAA
jgi:hypothetical protein